MIAQLNELFKNYKGNSIIHLLHLSLCIIVLNNNDNNKNYYYNN